MTIDVDLNFPHRYVCEALDEIPNGPAPQRYPSDQVAGQDGVIVRVQPETAEVWVGVFAFGKFGNAGVTRVLSMPNPEELCVVANGAGYVVSATKPDVWETVRTIPIIDVRAIPGAGLVVFANFTEMLAYGEAGVKWRTKRLTWDGLKILAVGDRTLIGEYWDIRAEAMQRFEVDLATGAARGGIET
jgi:hypothetical protein